jgi:hypothetical protein
MWARIWNLCADRFRSQVSERCISRASDKSRPLGITPGYTRGVLTGILLVQLSGYSRGIPEHAPGYTPDHALGVFIAGEANSSFDTRSCSLQTPLRCGGMAGVRFMFYVSKPPHPRHEFKTAQYGLWKWSPHRLAKSLSRVTSSENSAPGYIPRITTLVYPSVFIAGVLSVYPWVHRGYLMVYPGVPWGTPGVPWNITSIPHCTPGFARKPARVAIHGAATCRHLYDVAGWLG